MPNMDCPDGGQCGACLSIRGIWVPTFGGHMTEAALAPIKLIKLFSAGGGWGGTSNFKDLKFIGFENRIKDCGATQAAIKTNHGHSDYHPIAHFNHI